MQTKDHLSFVCFDFVDNHYNELKKERMKAEITKGKEINRQLAYSDYYFGGQCFYKEEVLALSLEILLKSYGNKCLH